MSEQTTANSAVPKSRFRILRFLGILALLLIALVAAAPWIVTHTKLRDTTINAILASPTVTASTESASVGWISPMSVQGLNLTSNNKRFDVHATGITAESTPLQLLSSAPDLGTIRADKVHVRLELPLDIQLQERERRLEPTFKAIVNDGSLTVRLAGQDEPVIEVENVDMTFRVEKADEGRVLTLDPLVIFDKRKLTPKMVNSLLHLVDPTIAYTPGLAGDVSFSVDKLRVPIGVGKEEAIKRIEVEGKLVLHQISGEVKNPTRKALLQLLADMYGKQVPDVAHVAQDAEIHFKVREGRMHHEGLRIGFPDIDPKLQVTSRGSVGLDKTLDLFVELPRLDPIAHKGKAPAKCHITGTINNPKIAVEEASLVVRQPGRKDPIIAVNDIKLNMQVETTPTGLVLAVAPAQIFKKAKLSVVSAKGLVGMIAPDVQVDREVSSEISLAMDTIRIPLGVKGEERIKGMVAEGKLTLHQVTADVKTPMWQALIKLLADMHGKKTSNLVRLADDAEIQFQLRDGRLHHDGLRVGFPEIDPNLVVSSRGSIGIDESVDLHLELPRLRKAVKDQGPIKCHVTGTIRDPKISVPSASLVVQLTDDDKAALKVDNVDLVLGVETTKDGRMLTVAPVKVFDKRKLTPEMGDQLIKLIAPTLSDLSGVEGEISLTIETFRAPLGVSRKEAVKGVDLAGKLHLHHINVSTKTPLIQAMVKVLADMHGKKASDVVRIVKNAEVSFQVRKGRMYHEGLRLGFPDISPDLLVTSRGYVGLDTSLDLELEMPRIALKKGGEGIIGTSPIPVRFRVTGTIEKPIVTEIKAKDTK